MKILDRFIIKSFIGPFIMVLLIVVFILMMQFLWLYIDELVGKGLSLGVILEFLGWGGATMLPLALPLATLLASMMTLGTMGENNELLAIKAAGISLQRVLIPLICMSMAISVGAFFASNNLTPVAWNKIFTLREDIGRKKDEIKIPIGIFYDGVEGYTLRIDGRNDKSGMMYGVMVYNHSGKRGNESLTIADSGSMKMSPQKDYLIFNLYNGISYDETNTKKYRDTTYQLQQIDFTSQELVIPLENYTFTKSSEGKYSDQVKAMKLSRLLSDRDSIGRHFDSTITNQKVKIMAHSTLKYLKQYDSNFNVQTLPPLQYDSLGVCTWPNLPRERDALQEAISKANEHISMLTSFSRETYGDIFLLRRIDIEILKKFSQALACFVLFFIGAPLGAIIRKGGLGTPAIISVLFFVLYWVVDISSTKLQNDGAVNALVGAFLSTFVLAPIGAFITWKAINDSSILDMDAFKIAVRRFKNKITGRLRKVKIVYMGTPEFAVPPLDELRKAGYKISAIVTVADKASGRGLKVNESAVKKYAVEHKIPVLQPVSLKDPEFIAELESLKPDLFVVVAFRMLPEVVWKMPRLGTINLHASLLPQYRGAAPINWAIINGEKVTGVTTFMIDKEIDTGKVILQEQIKIQPEDNAGTMHDKLCETGSKLLVRTVDAIIDGKLEMRRQDMLMSDGEILRPAPKLTKELCHIDFRHLDGKKAVDLIRGLSPYPGAFFKLYRDGMENDSSIKVFEAEFIASTDGRYASYNVRQAEPGSIISDGKHFLGISVSDGIVLLKDIQMAGKKRMGAEAFLLGFREPESYRIA